MDEALSVAAEGLRTLSLDNIPSRCAVTLVDNKIKILYLGKYYLISQEPLEIADMSPSGGGEVTKRQKLIMLHYLIEAKGTPLTGRLIDFRDVPAGNMYYSVFEARVNKPFLKLFSSSPLLFVKASEAFHGEKIDLGDIAYRFFVLPRVPVNFILHRGDEEFSPSCKVLFDSSISDYLPTEDIAIACEDLVIKMGDVPVFSKNSKT